jgi:hypothetical protein
MTVELSYEELVMFYVVRPKIEEEKPIIQYRVDFFLPDIYNVWNFAFDCTEPARDVDHAILIIEEYANEHGEFWSKILCKVGDEEWVMVDEGVSNENPDID